MVEHRLRGRKPNDANSRSTSEVTNEMMMHRQKEPKKKEKTEEKTPRLSMSARGGRGSRWSRQGEEKMWRRGRWGKKISQDKLLFGSKNL